ncbi:MAG TPA: hypothetical protein VFP72_20055 [Kineosporiaceae bacterium]|nr:hypothetical protein [Kineosporiaceae bacterium]
MTRPVGAVPASRRRFSPLRDLPAAAWLLATAVAAALAPAVAVPGWLLIHLVVLGAAGHAILVWSRHFADTLLHLPSDATAHRHQAVRLVLFNGGALLVITGVLAAGQPLVIPGACAIAVAAVWHAGSLRRQLRQALPSRFRVIVLYYVAAAALLPVGALLGTVLAAADDVEAEAAAAGRLVVAHVVTNVLGWLGLTVLGTLVTLWPTALRTRLVEGAERAASRALPVLLAGILLTVAVALWGPPPGAAAGLVGYLAGVAILAVPFAHTLRTKPATHFATWSLLAGMVWYVAAVGFVAVDLATATDWRQAGDRLDLIVPALVAGFAAQVLVGALSYLLPVALGGGPAVARRTNALLGRAGALRILLVNGGLALTLPPVPSPVRGLAWVLVVGSLASFLVLVPQAGRLARSASGRPAAPGGADGRSGRAGARRRSASP